VRAIYSFRYLRAGLCIVFVCFCAMFILLFCVFLFLQVCIPLHPIWPNYQILIPERSKEGERRIEFDEIIEYYAKENQICPGEQKL